MTTEHPVAYVVHEVLINGYADKDTRSAEEFGERRVLVKTRGLSSIFIDDEDNDVIGGRSRDFMREATARIREGLADYTRDDYLVLVGAPKLIAVASAVAAHRTGGYVRFLVWQPWTESYGPIEVGNLWEG